MTKLKNRWSNQRWDDWIKDEMIESKDVMNESKMRWLSIRWDDQIKEVDDLH